MEPTKHFSSLGLVGCCCRCASKCSRCDKSLKMSVGRPKTCRPFSSEGLFTTWFRPRVWKDRFRISEDVQWQDRAINDYTGNLSGIVGLKKHLHAPVKRKFKTTRTYQLRKKRISCTSTTLARSTTSSDDVSESENIGESQDESDGLNGFEEICDDNVRMTQRLSTQNDDDIKSHGSVCSADEYGEELNETTRKPVDITRIDEKLQQEPTVELDISSDDDDEYSVKNNVSLQMSRQSKSNLKLPHRKNNYSRLVKGEGNTRPRKKIANLWSTRGETLLGYDFVAGSVDNLKFLERLHEDHKDVKEFRETNRDECTKAVDHDSERPSDEQFEGLDYPLDHHCLHRYRVNDRFFAEAEDVDRRGCSVCSICLLLGERPFYQQTKHLSIMVPANVDRFSKPQNSKRSTSKSKYDSLALFQNCDF